MDLDTRIREHNASLPLAERQQQARELGYIDGKPLNEDDYRRCTWAATWAAAKCCGGSARPRTSRSAVSAR